MIQWSWILLRDMVNALAGQVRSQRVNGGRDRSNDFSRTRFSGGNYRGNSSSTSNGPSMLCLWWYRSHQT